jgi:NADH dehydrogenase
MDRTLPHVVIVGAGFGGLNAALVLKHEPVRVTVIDRHNYHLFQPLLYQVATAGLSAGDIAYPIRAILNRQKNTRVLLAEASAVKPDERTVVLTDGTIAYDYLILAAGARHSYFGHPEWETRAPGLKSVDDALEIRRRLLLAFERAEREPEQKTRRALLTFVVVGAGPTGVELAGAIAEIAFHVMVEDFRSIDPREACIILIEAGPRILPSFPEDLSAKAEDALKRLGVDVRTNSPVTSLDGSAVAIGDQRIAAATILWAAGVTASHVAASLGTPLDHEGRVLVEPDLTVPGHPELFVIGDLAAFTHQTGHPLPGLAPVAIQQGEHAARNIVRRCQGQPTRPFHYVDRGTMTTIGRAKAIADLGAIRFSGFPAWIAWIFVHIFFLIGFRNRFVVLFNWAWAYITTQRSARLITGERTECK